MQVAVKFLTALGKPPKTIGLNSLGRLIGDFCAIFFIA
jgi:hypothetical protein